MSTATKESGMKSDELRAQITDKKQNIEKLKTSQDECIKRRAELEAERKLWVMPARLGKDAEAVQRLEAISHEIEAESRKEADYSECLAYEHAELAKLEQALAADEFNKRREELQKKLASLVSVKRAERLAAAVENVKQIFDELVKDYESAAAEILQFDGSLRNEAAQIRRLKEMQSDLIAARLSQIISVQLNWAAIDYLRKRSFGDNALHAFERALGALDGLGEESEGVA